MKSLLFLAVAACAATPVCGQQTGDLNRDYVIDGIGAGGTSPVVGALGVPGVIVNTFSTSEASAPIVWAGSNTLAPGQFQTPFNSADLGTFPAFADVVELASGITPGIAGQFFQTDAGGSFQLSLTLPSTLAGSAYNVVMAVFTAANPDSIWLSQVHQLSFALDPSLPPSNPGCNPAALPLTLGDDTFVNQALGFSLPFYGQTYSDLYVGANGYVTFAGGDMTLGENLAGFLSGLPRIALWWDDLNPSAAGTVTYFTDNATSAEVCFTSVPEFSNTGANSMKLGIVSSGSSVVVTIDYGSMTAIDGMVGLSPGTNIDPSGLPLNLSVGPNVLTANQAPFELFDVLSPNDLSGLKLSFVLDASGNPTMQF